MDVHPATATAEPDYPTRKEFQTYRHLFGAAVLGAGMAMTACTRPMGAPSGKPANENPPSRVAGGISGNPVKADPSMRLGGVAPFNSTKPQPPHHLAGRVMVVPKPDAPPVKPPAAPDSPMLPGVPPAR